VETNDPQSPFGAKGVVDLVQFQLRRLWLTPFITRSVFESGAYQ